MVDEYYFWITDSRHYTKVFQDADVVVIPGDLRPPWHQDDTLPTLLQWPSRPMVHLMWCRVHDGELQQPRRSHEGVRINQGQTPVGASCSRTTSRMPNTMVSSWLWPPKTYGR